MRIDLNICRDPDLLAAEVRRLESAIAALADQDAAMVDPVAYAVWNESEDAPGRIATAHAIKGLRGTGETRDGEEFIALYGKPTLTGSEREAVEFFGAMEWPTASLQCKARSATLRGLLERLA